MPRGRGADDREIRSGVHHVTAIAGDPGENVRFYRDLLGLRLLKRTVNHDDPGTHHLYFGDAAGRPGSTLTFFPWPQAPTGRQGRSQVGRITLAAPEGSLDYWRTRLAEHGVDVREGEGTASRRRPLWFGDPDGLALGVAEADVADPGVAWDGPVPEDHTLRGIASVDLLSRRPQETVGILTDVLGMEESERDGRHEGVVLSPADGGSGRPGPGARLLPDADLAGGRLGVGTVHHVAWRVPDAETQDRWRRRLVERGMSVTDPVDRYYFRSIYFREPGGILFEVATEGPGFTRDEPLEALGSGLRLPPWLQDRRREIEERLPAITGVELGEVG